jgi:hypothetical protein
MTWLEIYNAVCMRIWGVQTPPEGAVALLQGANGVIGQVHHNIQTKRNYWFMEAVTTFPIVAGTMLYDLPVNFKEIVLGGLRFVDATSGQYYPQLKMILPIDYNCFSDNGTADYPEYYEIWGGQLALYPMPKSNQTLHMRYYKYFDRPPAVFAGTSDLLTIHGSEAIYDLAAAEVLLAQEEYQKAALYDKKGSDALELLNFEDEDRRRPEVTQVRYQEV